MPRPGCTCAVAGVTSAGADDRAGGGVPGSAPLSGSQRRVPRAGGPASRQPRLQGALGPPVPRSLPTERCRGPLQRSARVEERPRRRPAGPGPGGRGEFRKRGRRPGAQGAGVRSQADGGPGTAGAAGARGQRQRQSRGRGEQGPRHRRLVRRGQSHPRHRRLAGRQERHSLRSSRGPRIRNRRPLLRHQSPLRGRRSVLPQGHRARSATVHRALATGHHPHAARGYEPAAHFFVINRRYEEGVQYYRKAIELDPQLYSARSQLGITLMRLGQDQEAYTQLETCYNNGFQDAATRNSLKLLDSYKKFDTVQAGRIILRLDRKEAELLRPYFESAMERIIATYEKKYRLKLEKPVRVEVYPDHEDFAVRTLGMPGLGALGVTFTSATYGSFIAMDSPSGRPPGSFHWASTLWHEMSHVFTLTLTDSHVPRWFTEGLAVHEETAVSPEWGDRLAPPVIMAIKDKKLLPVSELDRGFVHPTGPEQVVVSYFQAGRICDYINGKWGWATLLAMLRDFGNDDSTAAVIRKELKMEPAEFDKQFLAFVEADTKNVVDHFDEWQKRLKVVNSLAKNKDYGAVIKEGVAIRDMYPDYVESGSVYEFLADAYLAKDDKAAAIAELERYVKAGGRNPDSIKLLAKQLEDAGRKKEAADALNRLNYIYPIDNDL